MACGWIKRRALPSRRKAAAAVGPPGAGEHQTGLAADLAIPALLEGKDPLTQAFADTVQGAWLQTRAHARGFIVRYPKGKEESTRVIAKPWHVRYVGAVHAHRMFAGKLCVEEYLYDA